MGEGPSRLTIAVSMGDYQNTRFTLGGETPEDFVNNVQTIFKEDAATVLDKYKKAFLNAPYYDVSGGASNNSEQPQSSGPPDPWGGSGSSSTPAASSGGGGKQWPEDPGKPDGPPPECEHGPKVWRNPPDKDWRGWFCSARKRSGSCSAEFIND